QSEKEKDELRVAWATMERGELLLEQGHPDAAREAALAAETRLQRSKLLGDDVNLVKRSLLLLRAAIGLALHDPRESEAAARLLTAELAKAPSNFDLRAEVHFAQGLAALAEGESKRAMQELLVCPLTMPRCRYALAKAQGRAGDLTGADDTIAFLLHHPLRDNLHRGEDPAYLVVRARLASAQAAKQ
ncbi:MAG: hypothetical protein JST92_27385, partial [Deltaproteobacteria bacterium]|nr:hypothetical protein [Deltaproteobacteria bacterium]